MIDWIRAILIESFAIVFSLLLRPLGYLWNLNPEKKIGKPILLIHGYLHDSSAWIYLRFRLRLQGLGPIYLINLKPKFCSIRKYVEQVRERVEFIEKETGRHDLVCIGHSMGGIVASLYALESGKVTDVITIGSPLKGTYLAYLGLGKNAKEMRQGSELLMELERKLQANPPIHFHNIASQNDQIVIPQTSAGDHHVVSGLGHISLLYSPRVFAELMRILNRAV